jgi:hypothetical protein
MGKIKVLFLAANPSDTGRLRLDEEARQIFEGLEMGTARDEFELVHHLAVRVSDLQRILLRHKPHVVHFSGHGSEVGEIVLEDDFSNSKQVSKGALAKLFKLHKDNIRIVFLNACFMKDQAQAISEVIDFTVGTNKAVGDNAAAVFAGSFYRALAFERSVKFAFESGQAELELQGIAGADTPEIFVRGGVDPDKPFLEPVVQQASKEKPTETLSPLRNALADFVAERLEDRDQHLIQQALIEGRLALQQIEGGANTDAEFRAMLWDNKGDDSIQLELSESFYKRFHERIYPPPPGLPPPLPGLVFVGREEALSEVKQHIGIGSSGKPANFFTVVRGWPGVGKTTLVGVLARDPAIAEAFPDGVLWTALEQNPELISKLAAWGRTLGIDLLRIPGVDEAAQKLSNLLRYKRMLLIVDDIWDAGHALPFLHVATGSNCSVLATTRLTSVADALARLHNQPESETDNVYVLPVLTEDHALSLLRYLAPTVVRGHVDECLQLARDLECLPLALHVAGRLLNEEAKLGLDVVDLIHGIREGAKLLPEPAPVDRAEGATIPTVGALLRRSTDQLDEETREYFAYLGVFVPKPATFDVAALRSVWMIEDPKPVIRKLVGYGLLEPVGNGRFQMHALLVQHAQSLLN